MTKLENNILLLSVTFCWASSYIFVKRLSGELSTFAYLTLVTGIAAVILTILFFKQFRHVKKSTILSSLVLSLLLTAVRSRTTGCNLGFCRIKPLSGPPKRRKQPGR
jgi:drug/metabolite transporter (DMT)-like permease